MAFLNELRILLIDLRIALREARPGIDEDPLWGRLEQAVRDIGSYVLPPPVATSKTSAQQVALAWQTVARGLKLSQPKLYDEMAAKVMSLLDERELVEPVAELLQMEAQVKKLEGTQKSFETRLAEQVRKSAEATTRLEQLYQALANATSKPVPGEDPQSQALARVEALLNQAPPRGGARGKLGVAAPAAASEGPVPSRAVLEQVIAGARPLTREQREWSVGECLGLCGWQFTPLELIEKGDAFLAQTLLAAPNPPA